MPKKKKYVPEGINIVSQGYYVANSLQKYLQRHTDLESKITKGGTVHYLTTENPERFQQTAQIFLRGKVDIEHVRLT